MDNIDLVRLADDPSLVHQLILAARAGCQKSLEQLIAASRNYLAAIANRELPGDVRAKIAPSDVVQESLIEAYRDFSHFTGTQRPELFAWLRTILLHNLANAKRKYRGTSKRELAREMSLDAADETTGRPMMIANGQSSPSSIVLFKEQAEQLQAAIAKLPGDYKEVILLRHQDHLPFDEIATKLNRTAVSARKIWSRAIERLQQELDSGNENE